MDSQSKMLIMKLKFKEEKLNIEQLMIILIHSHFIQVNQNYNEGETIDGRI